MIFFVLRHPACHHVLHECVVGCPLLSRSSYEHVPISHRGVGIDLLQSCSSLCYVIQLVLHVIHECVVGCPILSSMYEHVPIYHRDVGIDFPLQSCCSWCYVIQPVYRILHECVVGCPILSSMYKHVPIYHSIVLDSTPSNTPFALTSHHRVRCSSGLKQLAKHYSHVTNAPCKAPKKIRRGRYSFICPSFCLFCRTG